MSYFTEFIMFFFRIIYPNYGMKEERSPSKEMDAVPSKKPVCVMHPENAPRMLGDNGFPKDFDLYEYAGATLEVLPSVGSNGKKVRRPALVAKMIHRAKVEEGGAFIEVEMTASLSDLRQGEHPNAEAIAAALKMYYEEKIPVKERAIKKQPVKAKTPKLAGEAAPVKQNLPTNDFFMKMNAPLTQASRAR